MNDVSLQSLGVPEDQIEDQIKTFTTWEDFISAGIVARTYKDKAQWVLGNLSLGIENKWGEDRMGRYAKEIGVAVTSLRVYRWVVKKFRESNPDFIPPEKTPFSVLQAVANLPNDARESLLERAEIDDMSVEHVRIEVKKLKGQKIRPRFTLQHCEIHDKWQVWYNDPNEWELPHE